MLKKTESEGIRDARMIETIAMVTVLQDKAAFRGRRSPMPTRKIVARLRQTREKQYRKTSGFSPPPSVRDHRDRDERHGRLARDRSPPARHLSTYDRERRDREVERERLYRTRADPRGSRDELNYGEESRSVTGSERRRRREGSEDSVESGRRSAKRHRRDRKSASRDRGKTKTPEPAGVKKEKEPEPAGFHSAGSEDGEIEED